VQWAQYIQRAPELNSDFIMASDTEASWRETDLQINIRGSGSLDEVAWRISNPLFRES